MSPRRFALSFLAATLGLGAVLAQAHIPAAFWQALRQRGFVSPDAPIPAVVTTDRAGLPASR